MSGPVKRFLVFVYDEYYPAGGWGDLLGSYDTIAEAVSAGLAEKRREHRDFVDIVDLQTGACMDADSLNDGEERDSIQPVVAPSPYPNTPVPPWP